MRFGSYLGDRDIRFARRSQAKPPGETACATTHTQPLAEQGGAGAFACQGIFQQSADALCIIRRGANKKIEVSRISWKSMPRYRRAPTIRYSALFEFKHPTNSFKSRLSGIVSRSFPNFEENIDSLARGQPRTKESIRVVGVIKAVEDLDDLLHASILPPGNSIVITPQ